SMATSDSLERHPLASAVIASNDEHLLQQIIRDWLFETDLDFLVDQILGEFLAYLTLFWILSPELRDSFYDLDPQFFVELQITWFSHYRDFPALQSHKGDEVKMDAPAFRALVLPDWASVLCRNSPQPLSPSRSAAIRNYFEAIRGIQ